MNTVKDIQILALLQQPIVRRHDRLCADLVSTTDIKVFLLDSSQTCFTPYAFVSVATTWRLKR